MFLCHLRLVVFLCCLLAGIRMSALGEALSSASWKWGLFVLFVLGIAS